MKNVVRYVPSVALASLAMSFLYAPSALAAGDVIGETQRCVSLRQIRESPIIDEQTILMKMGGTGGFKRVDLMGKCPGITFDGYARSSPENSICTSDTLTVIGPINTICKIAKIVNIDAKEAASLEARKK